MVTPSRSLTYATIAEEQAISDKLSTIYTASTKVSSIAARGVLGVVKAHAGASLDLSMASRTADGISSCMKHAARLAASDARCAHDVVRNISDPAQIDLSVIMDSKPKAARISRWADNCVFDCRMVVGKINRAEGKYAQMSLHHRAGMVAGLTTMTEIARIVADVVEARIAIETIAPALKSVPSVQELISAIDVAAPRAAFAVVEAAAIVDRGRPPPYEEPYVR